MLCVIKCVICGDKYVEREVRKLGFSKLGFFIPPTQEVWVATCHEGGLCKGKKWVMSPKKVPFDKLLLLVDLVNRKFVQLKKIL
jgi:hypothetical protein